MTEPKNPGPSHLNWDNLNDLRKELDSKIEKLDSKFEKKVSTITFWCVIGAIGTLFLFSIEYLLNRIDIDHNILITLQAAKMEKI